MGNSNRPNKLTHCVSLGSDPPPSKQPRIFFCSPEKTLQVTPGRQKVMFFYSFLHVIASNLLSDPEFSLASSLTEQCSNIYENCLKTGIAKA